MLYRLANFFFFHTRKAHRYKEIQECKNFEEKTMNNLTTWIAFLTGVISLIVAIISLLKVLGVERRIKHFERKSLIIYSDKPFGRVWQNKEKQEWFQKVAFEKKTINWRWKKGEGWAVWGIDFKEKQDFSDWIYTHSLEFDIKGQRGGESPSGVILEGYSKEMDELWKDIHKAPSVSTF